MPNSEQENCIIDCRVSDEIQLKGGSLENQDVVGRRLAEKNGWNVIKVFRKPHSATTTERDDIEEIIGFIKASKVRIHHYVFKCIDRFTREGTTEYDMRKEALEKIGVQIWDTAGIIQAKKNTLEHLGNFKYKWSYYSPSEGAEMLAAHQGKQEWRDIINRLIGAEIKLVQDGYAVRRAPDGLKNKVIFEDGKEKCVREADGERARPFQMMFELRAEGLDDKKIVDRLNATGFLTNVYRKWDRADREHPREVGKRGGKPLTVKQLQRYVQQTEYAGYTCEKWTHFQLVKMQQFDGIVSVDTFNQANRGKVYIKENADGTAQILHNYSRFGKVKRLRDNPEFPFKFLPCDLCPKPMMGSAPRSKSGDPSPRYHCGGTKSRPHPYYSIGKERFEKDVKSYLQSLQFDPDFLESFELVLNDVYRTREKEIVSQSSMISFSVANLKAEQAAALDALTVAKVPVVREKLEEKISELETKIQEAQSQRDEIEVTEKDVKSFIKYVRTVMEHPAEVLIDSDDMRAQRTLFGLVFDELPTYQEILKGTPKLSLVFRLSQNYTASSGQLVTLPGVEPGLTP